MRELEAILEAWRQNASGLGDAILATVVHVKGSAYRRPGARMLILPDGRRVGTISGGCLESSVAQKASWWTAAGTAVRNFDTTRENAAWEFGLGCNGVISVLLERCDSLSVRQTLAFLDALLASRGAGAIATVVRTEGGANPDLGARLFIEASTPKGGELLGSPLEPEIIEAAVDAGAERRSSLVRTKGVDLFLEWVEPPQHLVIFGAGHDVIPVNELSRILGWRVTIADTRPAYARAERFPGVDRVVALGSEADIRRVEITPDSAVVIMTHNYPVDQLLLPQILEREPCYLGLLGPRSRAERLFRDISRNIEATNVHAPVGLDIGGEGPQSIALSIVSEIQSILNARPSGPLRERGRPIHSPVIEVIAGPAPVIGMGESSEVVVCETLFAKQHV